MLINYLYSYLVNKKLLYLNQFDFLKGHSTEHTVAQLVNQIYASFENDNYTLVFFNYLFKTFDTIDCAILLRKLENYGIKCTKLAYSKSHLRNTTCEVPQGSIYGALLFLIYGNDLPSSSKILNPILFTDDADFFLGHKNIFLSKQMKN